MLPDTLTPSPEPARPGHSHGRAELLLSEGQGRTRVAACAWSLLPPRAASTLPCEPGLPQDNGPGRGGGLAEEEARRQRRGLPKQAAHQEGPWGRGWRPQAAGATGRALPVSSTKQLCLRQGEAATLKNKTPKGGTSPAALEDGWAPTSSRRLAGCPAPAPRPRGWETKPPGRGGRARPARQVAEACGWQNPLPPAPLTHPASGRRSSRKSPRPGPPGTSA